MKISTTMFVVAAVVLAPTFVTGAQAFSFIFSPSASNHAYAPPNPNSGNSAVIIQPSSGSNNTSTISQSGTGNHAFSFQSGSGNTSTITQSNNGGSQSAKNVSIGGSGNKQVSIQN